MKTFQGKVCWEFMINFSVTNLSKTFVKLDIKRHWILHQMSCLLSFIYQSLIKKIQINYFSYPTLTQNRSHRVLNTRINKKKLACHNQHERGTADDGWERNHSWVDMFLTTEHSTNQPTHGLCRAHTLQRFFIWTDYHTGYKRASVIPLISIWSECTQLASSAKHD